MRLERRRINHNRLRLGFRSRQAIHYSHENAHVAPTLPTVVERLVGAVFPGRITPAHPITVHENDATQHTTVINTGSAVALGKERPQTLHLFVRQPKQIAHLQSPHRA
ncbi:hypothetical protein HK24_13700 [Gluconobacter sp. DsW_058]|nr:hypothetical protein HK24_13700 [Gluconobacter sp. DsW_058]